jgi:hypothetical protein
MILRRSQRALPGRDTLLIYKFFLVVFLTLAVGDLAVQMTSTQLAGSLPWPLAQWAVTTPVGMLTLVVVGGLVLSIPYSMFFRVISTMAQPVDVTGLPLAAWPDLQPRWGDPAGLTRDERWLGRTQPERARNRRALALAALLLLSLLVTAIVSIWYGMSHGLDCRPGICPPVPDFSQIALPLLFLSVPITSVIQLVWIAWVERRCGVWFRSRVDSIGLGTYIRRPGITPEAAAAALQRHLRGANSLAQLILLAVLALALVCLLIIGVALLTNWLSTQWILG